MGEITIEEVARLLGEKDLLIFQLQRRIRELEAQMAKESA